jgi:hypothetical protein
MNIDVKIDPDQWKRLQKLAKKYNKGNVDTQLAVAINKAARKTRSATSKPIGMSQWIRKGLNVKAKDLNKHLKKATRAKKGNLSSTISLTTTGRMALKYFDAKQTAAGVTYKIDKRGPRMLVPSAFGVKPKTIDKLGGHAWKRTTKKRKPIQKLFGISPKAFAEENKMGPLFVEIAKSRAQSEVTERIRFLRKTGWGTKKKKRKGRKKKR